MQDHAARVFAQNLRAILLAPPVRGRVMGLDPGFRSGCKVAVLDEHGSLLETEVIFPHDLHGGRGGRGGKGGKGGHKGPMTGWNCDGALHPARLPCSSTSGENLPEINQL